MTTYKRLNALMIMSKIGLPLIANILVPPFLGTAFHNASSENDQVNTNIMSADFIFRSYFAITSLLDCVEACDREQCYRLLDDFQRGSYWIAMFIAAAAFCTAVIRECVFGDFTSGSILTAAALLLVGVANGMIRGIADDVELQDVEAPREYGTNHPRQSLLITRYGAIPQSTQVVRTEPGVRAEAAEQSSVDSPRL